MSKAGLRILVVEDEAVFRHSLVTYLEHDGACVFQAEDGIEGLSRKANPVCGPLPQRSLFLFLPLSVPGRA